MFEKHIAIRWICGRAAIYGRVEAPLFLIAGFSPQALKGRSLQTRYAALKSRSSTVVPWITSSTEFLHKLPRFDDPARTGLRESGRMEDYASRAETSKSGHSWPRCLSMSIAPLGAEGSSLSAAVDRILLGAKSKPPVRACRTDDICQTP